MEESSMDIVRDFEKLHVLASYDFQKMDELVQDLSLALEESSRSRQCARHDKHKTRKRRPRKRRPETTLLVPPWDLVNMSEASESSLDETLKGYMENVTRQSDSEENGGVPSVLVPSKSIALVESDSFTDNFTPRFSRRRRRKCKRMAVDPQPSPGAPDHDFLKPRHVRRTKGKSDAGDARSANRFTAHTAPGKRKRISNFPDKRTTECDDAEGAASKRDTPQRDGEAMDFSGEESQSDGCSSCSSLSSSESDLGVYTNDEGREADDEQSDYYHEAGSTCGIPDVKDWWELDQQCISRYNRVKHK
ncbi:PREDICTED: G patch domain-containing protein 2-like [Priapulus caudatus]|uniref:G patch domain-containing protein 2-like n=1 Tax=Priapulus caudatus TaxID=37621 RepID=A0ABM1E5X3_PRICU|nr:PREDICTED: G patch domain-containing protein 2-like [Priapulus caudatus]